MAFSTAAITLSELEGKGGTYGAHMDFLTSALSANTASLSAISANEALSRIVLAAVEQIYRHPKLNLSAEAVISVHASSTSNLLTLQFQIIPAA